MPRIEIVEPRASWAEEFTMMATELMAVLDGLGVTAIDHIGSTAVPGLAAKDVIDIQVTVPAAHVDGDAPALREQMVAAGYTWRADIIGDHTPPGAELAPIDLAKRFASAGPGTRPMNIHFRVGGRFNHRYALLCRDYLRTHPAAAAAYGQIKCNLARLFPDDAEAYYDVKDPVFDLIMAAAEEWAAASEWTLAQPM
jgi:GrpB-like predicted nucleotidyltransferase (UPF0157 family)